MKVALDLDEVITNGEVVVARLISEDYGIDYKPEMQYQWSIPDVLQHLFGIEISSKNALEYWTRAWREWETMPLTSPSAVDTWWDIHSNGYDVDIVTYSPDDETLHNKKRFADTFMSGDPTVVEARNGKAWKYEMDYGVFVDDSPHVISGAVARGKKGILFDRPCNQGVSDSLVTARVKHVSEIVPVLHRISKGEL